VRRLDDEQLRSLEETSREYEMNLMESQEALSYLRGRGLSTSSIDKFRLGVVADPPPEHKTVAGRLAIPTLKRVGVTGFKFRCINPVCLADGEDEEKHEGHGKYQTFEKQSLFNVAALDNDHGFIALCEGELDAMTIDGECGIPAVGLVGVNSWHDHYYGLLKEFSRIWVFEDNDAGKAKNRGAEFGEFLADKFDQAVRVQMPVVVEGKKSDVNRVFRARGRDFVRGLIGL
jgi:DNA primase